MRKVILVVIFLTLSTSAFAALNQKTLTVNRNPGDNNLNAVQVYNAATGTRILDCHNASCSVKVNHGTKVKVTPVGSLPNTDFFQWGASTGSAAPCTSTNLRPCEFDVTQDSAITAVFKRVFVFRVQLGNGEGVIRIHVGGKQIDCANRAPLSCSQGALDGTRYKLEALAKPGSQFQGWSAQTGNGTICTGGGANFTCQFNITQETSLVANFIPIP